MNPAELPTGTPAVVSSAILIILWAVRQADVVPARYLPLLACGAGVIIVSALEGVTADAFILGLVCGAGATGFHQTAKQLRTTDETLQAPPPPPADDAGPRP